MTMMTTTMTTMENVVSSSVLSYSRILTAAGLGSSSRHRGSPSDLRNSMSEQGEMGMSATSQMFSRSTVGGSSPDDRRRPRRSSDVAKRPRSALVTLFDRVVPRRESLSHGGSPAVETVNIWDSKSAHAQDTRLLFKRRITTLYNTAVCLRSYVELNYSGFRKSLKKYVITIVGS
jgi:phosphate transporter